MDIIPGLEPFLPKLNPAQEDVVRQMKQFGVVGQSPKIITSFLRAQKAAKSYANILIEGESGTGKEVFTQAIHNIGYRSSGPMVKLNCAEIPETLLESELFGYERGAFTGATKRKIGKFEVADNGTIFLDEIAEMSLGLQAKMLRVIENKTISRVGGLESIGVDVRILSATNRDLWQHVTKGHFREDLYYRLNVIYLHLPPLRERREDIPLLINHFIKKYIKIEKIQINSIDAEVVKLLLSLHWSGNVRQLENVIHHAIIMSYKPVISIEDLPENILQNIPQGNIPTQNGYMKKDSVVITDMDLDEMEKSQIILALEQSHWKISDAANILGVHRNTLSQKIKKFKIR